MAVASLLIRERTVQIQIYDNKSTEENRDQSEKIKSTFDHLVDFSLSHDGTYRILQALERICRMVAEIFQKLGHWLKDFFNARADEVLTAWTWLTIPRLFPVTKALIQSVREVGQQIPGEISECANRKKVELLKNSADAASAYSNAVGLLIGSVGCRVAGDIFDVANDGFEGYMALQDCQLAHEMVQAAENENVDPRARIASKETRTQALLTLAKVITSIAGGILSLCIFFFGAPLLPALLLIGIALASTSFAIAAAIQKASSDYETVDFFRVRHVHLVTSSSA